MSPGIKGRPLLGRVLGGSLWSLGGHGAHEALRLTSNLILTRLLLPEHFGLMALVQVVLGGLRMFSNVGVVGSVVRHPRGDEPAFLHTAWTIQVIRGFALTLCAVLLATPIASFYDEPRLRQLIPVVALGNVLSGFASPALLTLKRQVQLRQVVTRELASQLAALTVTVSWALRDPSVWALVAGGLTNAICSLALSYWLLPGARPRFTWEPEAAREIYSFGRWVLLATAFTFVSQQGDRAILGKLVSTTELGVFSIASFLARAVIELMLRLNSQVLIPIYARIANETPERLRGRIVRARISILLAFVPPLWLLALFGPQLVDLLYDPRFADAGWMLQILAVGAIVTLVSASSGSLLLALGDSFRHLLVQVVRGTLLILCMLGGFRLGGVEGLLWGIAASRLLAHPVTAWAVHRHGAWIPWIDAATLAASAAVIGLGWSLL